MIKLSRKLLVASFLTSAANMTFAQLPFDLGALSDAGLPGIEQIELLSAGEGSFDGGFSSMPDSPLPGMDSLSMQGEEPLISPPSEKLASGGTALFEMGSVIAQNPASLSRPLEKLVIPVGFTLFPVIEVLATDPDSLGDYFMNGGTIFLPDLVIVPRIPLFNEGL